MQKTVIIVEHDTPKEFLLKKAKERGYRVVMVANSQNELFNKYLPNEDVLITDVFNLHTILEDVLFFVKKNNLHIDAVGTFSEELVVAASDIAQSLGCKGIGQLASRRTSSNKLAMRMRLDEVGIMQPAFSAFNIFEDNDDMLRSFPKPCVIKPIFGTSSHGVILIEENDFDYKKIQEIVKATVNRKCREAFRRFRGNMLVEEYIPGDMISVDGFVNDGKVSIIGTLEFIMGKEPYFTQTASYIPARLSKSQNGNIQTYVNNVIHALDFDCAPFHMEIRIKNGKPHLVEIAGRMAGATIHEAYDKVYGIDMIGLMFDCWFGELSFPKYQHKGINYHELFYPKINDTCILSEVKGIDDIRKEKDIWHFKMISDKGDTLKTYPNLPTPLFEYAIFSKNFAEIERIKDMIKKMITYDIQ